MAFPVFSSSSLLIRWTVGILHDCDTHISGLESRVEARETEILELKRDKQELENRCTHATDRETVLRQTIQTQKRLVESLRESLSRSRDQKVATRTQELLERIAPPLSVRTPPSPFLLPPALSPEWAPTAADEDMYEFMSEEQDGAR